MVTGRGQFLLIRTTYRLIRAASLRTFPLGEQDRQCYLLETLWARVLLSPPKSRKGRISFVDLWRPPLWSPLRHPRSPSLCTKPQIFSIGNKGKLEARLMGPLPWTELPGSSVSHSDVPWGPMFSNQIWQEECFHCRAAWGITDISKVTHTDFFTSKQPAALSVKPPFCAAWNFSCTWLKHIKGMGTHSRVLQINTG